MSSTRTRPPRRRRADGQKPVPARRDWFLLAFAAVVALLAVTWAAIRVAGRDSQPASLGAGDPGIAHVHGLGVNPADGSLYVATHYGTFRIADDGKAHRLGDSYQDTMGFTVAGPDRFLGSGHPDLKGFRAGQPRLLGLIESTDAGATWRALSLSGEVDFHALGTAGERVYGWDSTSGRFMVSFDRRTWETRSTRPLVAFAVDPGNAEHLVATSPDGLLASADGGRTWQPLAGPILTALSWDATAGLVGAEPDGTVQHSADGGATWQRAGRLPGAPQALLATARAWYAAAHDENGTTSIYRSNDAGRSWKLHYRDAA